MRYRSPFAANWHFVGADATAPVIFEEPEKGLRMDLESKRVWVAGEELDPPLSLAQYRLLGLLYQDPGRVFSRDEVVENRMAGGCPGRHLGAGDRRSCAAFA